MTIQEMTCAAFAVPASGWPGWAFVVANALLAMMRPGMAVHIEQPTKPRMPRTSANVA